MRNTVRPVRTTSSSLRVIIGGCGRVGASLASALDADGHDVVIIDRDERAFRRLEDGYGGRTVRGIVFDRKTLEEAGTEGADAFVGVTNGDNSNIVSARTALERFGVRSAVARIYDPARAEIYERHGVTTIATTRWATDAVLAHLLGAGSIETTVGPGEGDVLMIGVDLPPGDGTWEVASLSSQGRWHVVAVTRAGQTTLPVPNQLIQGGERVHLAVQRSHLEAAESMLEGLVGSGTGA